MPNIKSNAKSLKKDRARRIVRISHRKALKRLLVASAETGNISEVYKALDSQVSKGIIKKNKCNRIKSRVALRANKLSLEKSNTKG